MRNVKLIIEYEGAGYAGWQEQSGLPTIQGCLSSAIAKLTKEPVKLIGASRTDAGVHALGQTANFTTGSNIPTHGIIHGLNSILPEEIVIRSAADVPPEFDSRRLSIGKVYVYKIVNRPCPSAIMRRFTWFIPRPLDITLMRRAAAHFIGEHDFTSFRAVDSDALHSIRTVTSVDILEKGDGLIEIEVRGNAFLRHMIRIMTGTLVAVGRGRIKPDSVPAIIAARDRKAAQMTAPAKGLCLARVDY
ncbi:MAG: tRNA pseudouridine(38-40) synthase TruA [Deltaproteobacteria bacterium]|nr:tRNA pseudouridine(38-40) synthase TruA [Deltaproteobacteria bacterium]